MDDVLVHNFNFQGNQNIDVWKGIYVEDSYIFWNIFVPDST